MTAVANGHMTAVAKRGKMDLRQKDTLHIALIASLLTAASGTRCWAAVDPTQAIAEIPTAISVASPARPAVEESCILNAPGIDRRKMVETCTRNIELVEKQRTQLLLDKQSPPSSIANIDIALCYYKEILRSQHRMLGEDPGPDLGGCPKYIHKPKEFLADKPAVNLMNVEFPISADDSTWAGPVVLYPMGDSGTVYLAIDHEVAKITMPSTATPLGPACTGQATQLFGISLWGGIGGGYGGSDLVQNGVDIDVLCKYGVAQAPTITAWYEDFPNNTVYLDGNELPLFPINMGDKITFSVVVVTRTKVKFVFSNDTQSESVTYIVPTSGGIDQVTAEAVGERINPVGSSSLYLATPTANGTDGEFPKMTSSWSGLAGIDYYDNTEVSDIGINQVVINSACDYYTLPNPNECNAVGNFTIVSNGYDCASAAQVGSGGLDVFVYYLGPTGSCPASYLRYGSKVAAPRKGLFHGEEVSVNSELVKGLLLGSNVRLTHNN